MQILYKTCDVLYLAEDEKQDDIYLFTKVTDISKKYNLPEYSILLEDSDDIFGMEALPTEDFIKLNYKLFHVDNQYIWAKESIIKQKMLFELSKIYSTKKFISFLDKYAWYINYLKYNDSNKKCKGK